MARRLRGISLALGAFVIMSGLVVTAAIAGRAFLPPDVPFGSNSTQAPADAAVSTPSPTLDIRAGTLELRRDFEAIAATLRDVAVAPGSVAGVRDSLVKRADALRSELAGLPDSPSLRHYKAAASFLRDAISDSGRLRPENYDALNLAEAEWRKGDDLLK